MNEEDIEDVLLTEAPVFVAGRQKADADLAAGRTRSLAEVLADLDGIES
ncbi:MAG: hypothetical protein WKF43_05725 [Acidimicrobiales bacterium]